MMKAYALGLYEKAMPSTLSWKEKLEAAKEAGYDYVELSIDDSEEKIGRLDMPKKERLALVETMYEAGIPIRTMCVSALTNPIAALAQKQLSRLKGCGAHFTVVLSDVDENLYKRLGMHVSYEAKYERQRLYYK